MGRMTFNVMDCKSVSSYVLNRNAVETIANQAEAQIQQVSSLFTAPTMKVEPKPSTLTVPESNATMLILHEQTIAGTNCDTMQTMNFFIVLVFG